VPVERTGTGPLPDPVVEKVAVEGVRREVYVVDMLATGPEGKGKMEEEEVRLRECVSGPDCGVLRY
jgi:hypothetical protein